jgi:hypothetical protein
LSSLNENQEGGTPIVDKPVETAAPAPVVVPEPPQQQQGKYAKRTIHMVGYDDCGHCSDAETYFKTELIPNSDIPVEYKKTQANSDEGKAIVSSKHLEFVPFIEHCLIPKDPNETPQCEEFKSFKKSKFKQKVNSE